MPNALFLDGKDLPYFSQLQDIRYALEYLMSLDFPHGCCSEATNVVSVITGLLGVGGYFAKEQISELHFWNFDPKRNFYVDITLDQFCSDFPPIAILPSTNVFAPDDKYTRLQRDYNVQSSHELVGKVKSFISLKHALEMQTSSITLLQ